MSRILCVVIYSLITELDVYITGPRTFGHSGSCRKGGGGCPPGEAVPGKGTGPAERTGPGQTKRQQGWRIMQVSVKSYSPQMWILQLPSYLQHSCWKEHMKHDEDNVQ